MTMVRHVILFKIKEEIQGQEKEAVLKNAKENLEGLVGKVPGLLTCHVYTNPLPSSSGADYMLDTTFESEAALLGYRDHPNHVAVANTYVRPFIAVRTCMDFEI